MNADDIVKYAGLIGAFGAITVAAISAAVSWLVVRRTSSATLFTVRATVRTGYRTRWLEEFRACVIDLIYLGQQVHSPLTGAPLATLDERRELRKRAAHLIVLLGRGTKNEEDPRPKLAEAVRSYALVPSPDKELELEELIRAVFRERWNQITHETGKL
ncbi:MAG: hypothetical protein ABIT47_02940 [Candidatus Paceibacterota bacterium]